jgi:hypothetical protein
MKKDILIILMAAVFEIAIYELYREHLDKVYADQKAYHDELLYKADRRNGAVQERPAEKVSVESEAKDS